MKYININQKLNFKFCQVPRKILYTEPYKSILCPLFQLGYIFILDRLNLSRMNNKVDDYGNIYVFITRKEMGEYLKSSSKTVIKVFKELENANLIKIQIVSSVFGYKQYNDNYDKTGLLKFAFFRTNLCRFLYKHIKEINLRLQNEIDLSN